MVRTRHNGLPTADCDSVVIDLLEGERVIYRWAVGLVKWQRLKVEEEQATIHREWTEWETVNGERVTVDDEAGSE